MLWKFLTIFGNTMLTKCLKMLKNMGFKHSIVRKLIPGFPYIIYDTPRGKIMGALEGQNV